MAETGVFQNVFRSGDHAEQSDVRDGTSYGNGAFTGALDPGAGGTIPSANDVRFGVDVGQTTGLLVVPNIVDVRLGTNFDTSSTGSLDLPAQADVRLNTQFDGNTKTGTLNIDTEANLPGTTQVLQGVTYGSALQFTGTLDPGGGVVVVSPVLVTEDFETVRGDDQSYAWNNVEGWPDVSAGTLLFGQVGESSFEKAMLYNATDDTIELALTKAETAAMRGFYRYDIQHTDVGGNVTTLAVGTHRLKETKTDVPANPPIDTGWPG